MARTPHKSSRKNRRRVTPSRPAGIAKNSDAPFWKGVTAESIVADRISKYPKKKSRSGGSARPRSPHNQLRRLERALPKRKTEAGRESVRQRIAELKALLKEG